MVQIKWGRVVLCGVVTGVVWGALAAVVLPLVGQDFLAAIPIGNPFSPLQPGLVAIYGLLWVVMGVWMMWLYAAIRPRYGPGPKTAAVAALAVWLSGALVDLDWVNSGLTPLAFGALLVPLAVALPAHIAATLLGAWQYKE